MTTRPRTAFTLIELLVVITIIGIMCGIMLPAVQAAREVAHRARCQSNVARLVMATQSYEGAQTVYPPGVTDSHGPIQSRAEGMHHNWIEQLLPYIDERTAYAHIDFGASVYDPKNAAVRALMLPELICPTDSQYGPHSSYAACHNDVEAPIDAKNNGVFFLNSRLRPDEITDGLAYTLFIAERQSEPEAIDLGWTSGTRATLRNTGTPIDGTVPPPGVPLPKSPAWSVPTYVGGFGSEHPGDIATAGCGDGSVRLLSSRIDPVVLRHLGNRADGQLINPRDIDP